MNSEIYRQQQRQKIQKLTEDLVGADLLTPDQAAKVMQGAPDDVVNPPLDVAQAQGTGQAQPQLPPPPDPATPYAQQEAARVQQFQAERQGTQVPTFAETLKWLTENNDVPLAHRNNYYKTLQELTDNADELYRRNIEWDMYTRKQQMRILNRIGIGHSIGIASGTGYLNMTAGWMQELWDTPNKWESFWVRPFGEFPRRPRTDKKQIRCFRNPIYYGG